ncbi:hypothetical protein EDB84DRAFT_1558917 [Lactarius hengduanensis]|nr:hypothetical protein EDB84DRAFT_1558917 [Lactarius hengduanensis]
MGAGRRRGRSSSPSQRPPRLCTSRHTSTPPTSLAVHTPSTCRSRLCTLAILLSLSRVTRTPRSHGHNNFAATSAPPHPPPSTLTPPPQHGRDITRPHRPGYHHLDPATTSPSAPPVSTPIHRRCLDTPPPSTLALLSHLSHLDAGHPASRQAHHRCPSRRRARLKIS